MGLLALLLPARLRFPMQVIRNSSKWKQGVNHRLIYGLIFFKRDHSKMVLFLILISYSWVMDIYKGNMYYFNMIINV